MDAGYLALAHACREVLQCSEDIARRVRLAGQRFAGQHALSRPAALALGQPDIMPSKAVFRVQTPIDHGVGQLELIGPALETDAPSEQI